MPSLICVYQDDNHLGIENVKADGIQFRLTYSYTIFSYFFRFCAIFYVMISNNSAIHRRIAPHIGYKRINPVWQKSASPREWDWQSNENHFNWCCRGNATQKDNIHKKKPPDYSGGPVNYTRFIEAVLNQRGYDFLMAIIVEQPIHACITEP